MTESSCESSMLRYTVQLPPRSNSNTTVNLLHCLLIGCTVLWIHMVVLIKGIVRVICHFAWLSDTHHHVEKKHENTEHQKTKKEFGRAWTNNWALTLVSTVSRRDHPKCLWQATERKELGLQFQTQVQRSLKWVYLFTYFWQKLSSPILDLELCCKHHLLHNRVY